MVQHVDLTPSLATTLGQIAGVASTARIVADTGTAVYHADDGTDTIIGGTTGTITPFVGDTTPPPVPSAPIVDSVSGTVFITWDGAFADDAEQPADFAYVTVLVDGSARAHLPKASTVAIGDLEPGTVATVTFTASDDAHDEDGASTPNTSAPTPGVQITVTTPVTTDQVAEITGKLSEAQAAANNASKDAAKALTAASGAVTDTIDEYAVSSDPNTAPTDGWSSSTPDWTPGSYIWSRSVTTKGDGTTTTGDPVLVTGNTGPTGPQGPKGDQGIQGPAGADGKSSYTHIAYATSANGGGFTQDPAGATYIGIYVDQTATDSSDPTKYRWSLIKGADGSQGVPGAKGADGLTPYFHTAWADSADGKTNFSTTTPGTRAYLGTYTDYTSADSTDASKYAWSKILGPQGPQGPQGATGAQGLQGPKGDQGIAGAKGADGASVTTVTPYYLLQGTGNSTPAKPTANPPGGSWSTTEPTYTSGTELFRVDLTALSSGSWSYSAVSKVSSYTASSLAAENAASAMTVANAAAAAAAGLVTANQVAPPYQKGRIWFPLDADDNVTGMKICADGTSWSSYVIMADKFLAPGSVGTVSIGDGVVTAPKIEASEELTAKFATFLKVTAAMLDVGALDFQTAKGLTIDGGEIIMRGQAPSTVQTQYTEKFDSGTVSANILNGWYGLIGFSGAFAGISRASGGRSGTCLKLTSFTVSRSGSFMANTLWGRGDSSSYVDFSGVTYTGTKVVTAWAKLSVAGTFRLRAEAISPESATTTIQSPLTDAPNGTWVQLTLTIPAGYKINSLGVIPGASADSTTADVYLDDVTVVATFDTNSAVHLYRDSAGAPTLDVVDVNNVPRIRLAAPSTGDASLTIYDENGASPRTPVESESRHIVVRTGSTTVTKPTTSIQNSSDITFASPFTASPTILISPDIDPSGTISFAVPVNASDNHTTSAFVIRYRSVSGTASGNRTFHWVAIGPVD